MYRHVRFTLILLALSALNAAVIDPSEKSSHNLYCQVFQSNDFGGESFQIAQSQKINNFALLTESWTDVGSNHTDQFYSFKLPASIPAGTNCVVKSCTEENFGGNCTVFKLSQERIQPYRLKSFECNCFNVDEDKIVENEKATDVHINGQASMKQVCDDGDYSTFTNFTTIGKTIVGVGRNYIWHKTDLSKVVASGSSPDDPIIFLKPASSYLSEGSLIHLPRNLGVIYYELELAVVIGKSARYVSATDAMDYVAGYALALDMTAKEILKSSISKGLPWTVSKSFDGACPIGAFIPKACIQNPHDLQLTASVNGVIKQNDSTSKMIFKIPQLIAFVSSFMTLEANDVILTGTPDGFGAVKSGDIIEGWLDGNVNDSLSKIKFVVA
ncbi:acylpyruvase FAHD1, mitochondrial-like [Bradysia coprophila]|uniref:acylpyruvase FAHD1, mitochondrial-like n=1 Tax=Bradysia coprophila TaxID=38358 RepID=UPI00187DAA1F|nr:acylpyruvase FAHD1, mitochondrial-like [Bradysia coprophila]